MKRTSVAVLFGVLSIFAAACGGGTSTPKSPTPPGITPMLDGGTTNNTFVEPSPPTTCVPGAPMVVRFYDAGQALAVLVTLPDGRRLLVDAGESAHRPCKGCKTWHERTKNITPKAGRRTFQDLSRRAAIDHAVKKSISGHATDAMVVRYATPRDEEQRAAIGKVVDIATARPLRPKLRA